MPPFSVLLCHDSDATAQTNEEQILSSLPASFRTASDDVAAPSRHVRACVEAELDIERLSRILDLLFLAGRPMPPRPLHHQLLLGRDIVLTEQMDLHLVWTTGRIFIKPVPRLLLLPHVWTEYLSCRNNCDCSRGETPGSPLAGRRQCERQRLRSCALGFLFSYAALVSHESDYHIAKERHLLPAGTGVTWTKWRLLVEQLDTEHIYPCIDKRFVYGELRLSRLHKIYLFSQRPLLRGYLTQWHQYRSFFQDNFTLLASAIVYLAIVLAAMQVGLATTYLGKSEAFNAASYAFTVFSILAPLAAIILIVLAACHSLADNWVATMRFRRQRLRHIQAKSESGRA